jgi:hypothetical protein
MMKLCDFIVDLARVKALLRSKPQWMLPTRQSFGFDYIITTVKAGKSIDDQHILNAKKTKQTTDIIAYVATNVKEDLRVTHRDLVAPMGSPTAPFTTSSRTS